MAQQIINVGTSENAHNGDILRTAFIKTNENFSEIYSALGGTFTPSSLVNGEYSLILSPTGTLELNNEISIYSTTSGNDINHVIETTNKLTVQVGDASWLFAEDGTLTAPGGNVALTANEGVNGLVGLNGTNVTVDTENARWTFTSDGTLIVPEVLPTSFLAVLDGEHMIQGSAIAPGPGQSLWQFQVEFQLGLDGTVQTMMDNPFPNPSNPGYVTGHTFRYTEADHGIPGYVFDIALDNVVFTGGVHWTANVSVTPAPEYPTTIQSAAAIKFTAGEHRLIFGLDGSLKIDGQAVGGSNVNLGNWEFINNQLVNNGGSGCMIQASEFAGAGLTIRTGANNNWNDWQFNQDGSLYLPNDLKIIPNGGFTSIGKRVESIFDDGVTQSVDAVYANLKISSSAAILEAVADPDGPNNEQLGRVTAHNSGVVLQSTVSTLAGEIGTSVNINGGGVMISSGDGVVNGSVLVDASGFSINNSGYLHVIGNTVALKAGENASTNIVAGESLELIEDSYLAQEMLFHVTEVEWESSIAPAVSPWAGLNSYDAYPIIMQYMPWSGGGLPPPSNIAPIAKTAKDAYELWQDAIAAQKVKVVVGPKTWEFSGTGDLTFPDGSSQDTAFTGTGNIQFRNDSMNDVNGITITNAGQTTASTASIAIPANGLDSAVSINNDGQSWSFDTDGKITLPNIFPKSFSAVFDDAHFTGDLTLTGNAWTASVDILLDGAGSIDIQTTFGSEWLGNPGYVNDMRFEFTEADHGIPGYILTLRIWGIQEIDPGVYTANLAMEGGNPTPVSFASASSIRLMAADSSYVFGANGELSVPGAIRKYGGLYLNSSGSASYSSTVLVNGEAGSVILRTDDGTSNKSLVFDVDGETSFPGRLNFSDGSTLGDNILTGAVDSDLGLEVKRTITVSDVAAAGSTTGTLIVDISANDDIIVVSPGWEINAGTEIAPQWMTVTGITFNPDNTAIEITVDGFEFEPGNTYTFKNPVPESNIWVIRSQTGGILGPGGAIITNETAPLGEGTYRELAIELPTPDGLNEQRWVFANNGDFTAPGDIFAGSFLGQSLDITDAGIIASTYAGDLQTLHVAGAVGKGLSLAVDGGLTSWLLKPNGTLTLPQYNRIESVGSNATISLNGVASNESIIELATRVDGETITSVFEMHPAFGIGLTSVRDVNITAGYDYATIKWDLWQGAEAVWVNVRDQDEQISGVTRPWSGMPSYEAYPVLMNYNHVGPELPPASNLAPIADAAKDAYDTWQEEQAAIKVIVMAKDKTWTFGNNGTLTLPNSGSIKSTDVTIKSVSPTNPLTTKDWVFDGIGRITFPNNTVQTTAFTGSATSLVGGVHSVTVDSGLGTLMVPEGAYIFGNNAIVGSLKAGDESTAPGLIIQAANSKSLFIQTFDDDSFSTWKFDKDGKLVFPDNTVQTTAYSPGAKGQWTVTTGTNTYSFTVDAGATYVMWVRGTTDNGVISWNATVTITNANLPAVGTSGAYVYTGGGTMLDFTAVPDRITTPASGGISRLATILGAPSTEFNFGINNASGNPVTVYYGYTKI